MAKNEFLRRSYQGIYFKIWLDGQPLSPFEHTLVEEIRYENTSTGSDMVTISIVDPDLTIISNPKIVRSTPVKVEAGYWNNYRTWIDGYISALDPQFPETGSPTLDIHVMDKGYRMNRLLRRKTYKNMSYAQIAKSIAKMYGMSCDADTSGDGGKIHESVTQSYETDIAFLNKLANEIGYLVYISADGKKLYFKDREKFMKQSPVTKLWYKRPPFDIIQFMPRIVNADIPEEIEEVDIDNKTKTQTKGGVSIQNKSSGKGSGGGGSSGSSKGSSSGSGKGSSSGGGSSGGGSAPPGRMKYDPYTGKWYPVNP